MKAVVNQPLGDIHGIHAVLLLKRVAEDYFMHRGQRIRQVVNAFEVPANVIRIQHGVFRRLAHARPVRKNVRQRANQHAEIAAKRLHAANRVRPHWLERQPTALFFHEDGHGTKRLENLFHRHRTCTWSTTAVRGRKRLVQVQVHNVRPEIAWARDSRERVHVGAVQVEQRAFGVQDLRNLGEVLFVNTQRRGIGDHQGRDIFGHQFP